jgi:hypothetical protein
MDRHARIGKAEHGPSQARAIAFERGFQANAFARRHKGNAVAADVAGKENGVSGPHLTRTNC